MEQGRKTHTKAAQDSATPRHTKVAEAQRGAVQRSTHQRSTRVQGQRNTTHSLAEQNANL